MDWLPGEGLSLKINGSTLEARCWGPSPDKSATIVLLHEGLGSVSLWRDFPEKLAAATGLGVFAYSRAGYGQSDPAELPRSLDYMTREAEDILPFVLYAAGVKKAVLLGHSDGASIAAVYGGTLQDHCIHALILIAPHFFAEDITIASIEKAKEEYQTTDLRSRLARHHLNVDIAFWGWNDAWLNPAFRHWGIEEVIPPIRVPVLVVQGGRDPYGTYSQVSALKRGLTTPLTECFLEFAKHAPHSERPDETLSAISGFLNTLLTKTQAKG